MKVAIFSTKSYDKEYFDRFNESVKHELIYFDVPLNHDTAALTKGYEAVCVFVNDRIDKNAIDLLADNGIRLIALRCAGFNNVDLNAAKEKGITILRVPAYSPEAVAEHTVSLILTLNRKTHKAYNRVREGNFSLEKMTGFNLFGKTVGVIGTGRIGAAFCRIMLGFGCKVIAYDLREDAALQALGVEYQSVDELFQKSDILSLHCPLTPKTHHLINKDALSKMKTGVMLINTSRGGLVHTKDAIEALKNGKIGYMGIDVYEQEEFLFFKDLSEVIIQDDTISRLMTFPNVLVTAHQAFLTNEALSEIAITTLKNISDFEQHIQSQNVVL
jgi:D-lactate dehydrogenase